MSETRPIRMKTSASTLASTGRSIKKREIMRVLRGASSRRLVGIVCLGGVRWISADRRQYGSLRFDLCAGKGPLNAFGHDPVAGIESGYDDPKLTLLLSGFDDFALNYVVGADHRHVATLLARSNRVVSRQQRLVLM